MTFCSSLYFQSRQNLPVAASRIASRFKRDSELSNITYGNLFLYIRNAFLNMIMVSKTYLPGTEMLANMTKMTLRQYN